MTVLVTGAQGQLGRELVRLLAGELSVVGVGREQLDVTDAAQVREVVLRIRPDVIVHAAAYTAVDQAESDEEAAFRVNATGTRHLAELAEEIGAKFCYVSTDYVFDGTANRPYREADVPNPQSVYGKSKRQGEQFALSLSSKSFVVRTSWVYGSFGSNFVKTMLKLARERDVLTVVNDQVGSPTYTQDLARFIGELIQTDRYGVYHATGAGQCSWFDFAKEIFAEANLDVAVQPCTTEEFVRPAPRPRYSVLDNSALRANGFTPLRDWRDALRAFLREELE